MKHCQSCHRWIAPRWRRCPWCKRWTGQPHTLDAEGIDAELHALVAMGVPMGVGFLFFGAGFFEGQLPLLGICWGLGICLLCSSLALLASAIALDVFLILWIGVLLVSVVVGKSWIGAVMPLLVAAFVLLRRRHLRARIRCDESVVGWRPPEGFDTGRCIRCGAAAHGVLAPRWSVSFLFIGILNTGIYRPLCLKHARLHAIPATVVSLLFGWWSIWGLVWTPGAIADNLMEGGVHAGAVELSDVEKRARIGWRAALPVVAGVVGAFFGLLEGVFVVDQLWRLLGTG